MVDRTHPGNIQEEYGIKAPILCIDPGLGGTGWAYFEKVRHLISDCFEKPTKSGVTHPRNKKASWEQRAIEIGEEVYDKLGSLDTTLIIEIPRVLSTSQKTVSAARKGDIVKLTFLAGILAGKLHYRGVLAVTPDVWKGQLTKEATQARIERRLGLTYKDHNEADAVGIGVWVQGGI